jgi:hypothetical protein
MRKFIAGQSLHPVDGDIYIVTEDTGEPDRVVLFKGPYTAETVGDYPTTAEGKVEFINKVLLDKGIAALTDEEIQFVKAR